MHVFGIAAMAVGVTGLLLLAGHLVWQQVKTLRHVNQLDEWAEDIPEWH